MRIFFKIYTLIIFTAIILLAGSDILCAASGSVKKGDKYYEKEEYDAALEEYDAALSKKPDDPVIQYNRAATFYRKGDFAKAIESFLKSFASEKKGLEESSAYNVGNSKYRIGEKVQKKDPKAALKDFGEALEYYKRSMEIDPDDMDAKINYEYTLKKMNDLKQESQEQQQQQQQQDQQPQQEQEKQDQEQKDEQQKKDQKQEKQDQQKEQEKQQQEKQREQEQQQKQQEQPRPQFPKGGKGDTIEKPESEMTEEEAEMLLRGQDEEEARMRAEQRKGKRSYQPQALINW